MRLFNKTYLLAASGSLIALTAVLGAAQTTQAKIYMDEGETLQVYGDFRHRFEADFDSKTSAGAERDDRDRLRIRARVGAKYTPTDGLLFNARIRTGANDSQQSPHITYKDLSGNDEGSADLNFDKYYAQAKHSFDEASNIKAWVGRNGLPIWKQNEMFWDDDVTVLGGAVQYSHMFDDAHKISLNTGYAALPVGMDDFAGDIALGQAVYENKSVENWTLTGVLGYYNIDSDKTDSDALALYQRGNTTRDYEIIGAHIQGKTKVMDKPLKLGFDLYENIEDYSSTDANAVTAANTNETTGFVASAIVGDTKKGHWLAGYYYADIEELAVDSSFAQDDWMRWGSATQTRGSNFKGHELRLGYGILDNLNVIARYYTVDALTSVEDGDRFRLDINFKF